MENLPSKICYECADRIHAAYETRKLCMESDAYLRKQLLATECSDIEKAIDDRLEKGEDDVQWDDIEHDMNSDDLSLLDIDLNDDKMSFVDLHLKEDEKHKSDNVVVTSNTPSSLEPIKKCPTCNKSFQCEATLNKHIFSHNKVSNCPLCTKTFSNTSNLKRHIATHSGQVELKCDKCDRIFGSDETTALFEHLKIHRFDCAEKSDDFLLECEICNEKTVSFASYNKHMKTKHNVEDKVKAFKCSTCGMRFASKQGMYRHVDNIHENNRQNLRNRDKNFLCTECGKGFFTNFHLTTHARSHNGQKPFSCKYCSKSFSQSSGLKIHTFIHMNIRPFACKVCQKTFTQYGHVREHLLTHTENRPYTCTICSHSFRVKGNLKAHMLIHLGKKPHVCEHCGNRFNQSTHLRQHIIKKHKINC